MRLSKLIGMVMALACSFGAVAQQYPDRAVKIVVAAPPGAFTDLMARQVATQLSARLKQPFVVENRSGANGIIGTQVVQRSPADGYTLQFGTADTFAINPAVYKKLPYNVSKDFQPVALAAVQPFGIAVSTSAKIDSLKALVDKAKESPNAMSYGSWGIGSTAHLAFLSFMGATGTLFQHVPYQGAAPALQDLLSGQIQLMTLATNSANEQHAKSGKLRFLAIDNPQRVARFPDVPTFQELGLKGVIAQSWYGFFAPANTPRPVIELLNREINASLQSPEVKAFAEQTYSATLASMTPEQFRSFIEADSKKWLALAQKARVELD